MKSVAIRRLSAASAATTNDLAHLDIVSDCVLLGIDCTITAGVATTGDIINIEVSTQSVCQGTTNDCNGVLANAGLSISGITGINCQNKWIGPSSVVLPRGTRIYLHSIQTGTTSTRITVNLHCMPI